METCPYTGEPKIETPSQRVNNRSVEIVVINQPFTPYIDREGNTVDLYYFARCKGHFEPWTNATLNATSGHLAVTNYTSGYTIINLSLDDVGLNFDQYGWVDIQVKAFYGYTTVAAFPLSQETDIFTQNQSAWGPTHTVFISSESVKLEAANYITMGLTATVVALIAAVTGITVTIMVYRHRRTRFPPQLRY